MPTLDELLALDGQQVPESPPKLSTPIGDLSQSDFLQLSLDVDRDESLKLRRQSLQQEENLFRKVTSPLEAAEKTFVEKMRAFQEPIPKVKPGTRVNVPEGGERETVDLPGFPAVSKEAFLDGLHGAFQGVLDATPVIGLVNQFYGTPPPVKTTPVGEDGRQGPGVGGSGFARFAPSIFRRIAENILLLRIGGAKAIGVLNAIETAGDLYAAEIADGLKRGEDPGIAAEKARERVLKPAGLAQLALSGLFAQATLGLSTGFEGARIAAVTGGKAAGKEALKVVGKNLAIDIPSATIETVADAFASGRGMDVDLLRGVGFTSLIVGAASSIAGIPAIKGGKVVPRSPDARPKGIVPDAETVKFSRETRKNLESGMADIEQLELELFPAKRGGAREAVQQSAEGVPAVKPARGATPTSKAPRTPAQDVGLTAGGKGAVDEAPNVTVKSPEPAASEQPTIRPPEALPENAPAARAFVEKNPGAFSGENPVPAGTAMKIAGLTRVTKPRRAAISAEQTKARGRKFKAAAAARKAAGGGVAGEKAFGKELKGKLTEGELESTAHLFTPDELDGIPNHVRGHPLFKNEFGVDEIGAFKTSNSIRALIEHGEIPQPAEIVKIGKVFGEDAAESIRIAAKRVPRKRKVREIIGEFLNIPKELKSAFDLSYTLRQGLTVTLGNPKLAKQGMGHQLQALMDEGYALKMDDSFHVPELIVTPKGETVDLTRLADKSGLERPSVRLGGAFKDREEAVMSQYIQTLALSDPSAFPKGTRTLGQVGKVLSRPVRATQRAGLTHINFLRDRSFKVVAADMIQTGGVDPSHPRAFRDLSSFLNAGTGRGGAGLFAGPWWNFLLWSPRFVTSRFEFWGRAGKLLSSPSTSAPVRKLVLKQLIGKAIAWTTIGVIAKIGSDVIGNDDIEVVTDPLDPRFLKFAMNDNTTIDISGGYGPALRQVAQQLAGQRTDPETRKRESLQRGRTAANFLRSKLAPIPSGVVEAVQGQTFEGEDVTPWSMLNTLLTPITIDQIDELIDEHGLAGLTLMVPEVLGAGASVFNKDRGKKSGL